MNTLWITDGVLQFNGMYSQRPTRQTMASTGGEIARSDGLKVSADESSRMNKCPWTTKTAEVENRPRSLVRSALSGCLIGGKVEPADHTKPILLRPVLPKPGLLNMTDTAQEMSKRGLPKFPLLDCSRALLEVVNVRVTYRI